MVNTERESVSHIIFRYDGQPAATVEWGGPDTWYTPRIVLSSMVITSIHIYRRLMDESSSETVWHGRTKAKVGDMFSVDNVTGKPIIEKESIIIYKESYNEGEGLPEPKWGPLMSEVSPNYPLQCPTCGSQDMYSSASPDDPEEIFPHETVRCGHCGHIADWYESCRQRIDHPTAKPMRVTRNRE